MQWNITYHYSNKFRDVFQAGILLCRILYVLYCYSVVLDKHHQQAGIGEQAVNKIGTSNSANRHRRVNGDSTLNPVSAHHTSRFQELTMSQQSFNYPGFEDNEDDDLDLGPTLSHASSAETQKVSPTSRCHSAVTLTVRADSQEIPARKWKAQA
jgi:hypothetical protein